MLRTKRLSFTMAIALMAGSLAGCHAPLPSARALEPAPAAPFAISQGNSSQGSDPLNLTAEQRRQMEAINQDAMQGDSSALQALLAAPTLDVAAVKAQLTQSDADIDKAVNAQLKLRGILTPQQRTTLIAAIQQPGAQGSQEPSGDSQMQAMQQQLKLTPDQTRALSAMTTALQQHEKAHQSSIQQAHVTLLSTGDATAYRQALSEANRTMPVDAMVAFYSSLSQSQRRSLLSAPSSSDSGS